MRIGINTLVALPGAIGGSLTYTRNLVQALADVDAENEYYLFVAPWNRHLFAVSRENFHQVVCPIPASPLVYRVFWEQSRLPLLAQRLDLAPLHSPSCVSPIFLTRPSVVTLHDVATYAIPQMVPPTFRYYWRFSIRASAARAKIIISDSEAIKEEIHHYLGAPKAKIVAIYLGVSPLFHPLPEGHRNKGPKYLIWAGKDSRHKNVKGLLEAFAILVRRYQQDVRLVLCGMPGWWYEETPQSIHRLHLQDYVISKGFVPDEELACLYAEAEALVFPSFYEGFGIPILEAMASGTPVITSHYGATAEIAGKAALLVDPHDTESLAEAMNRVLTDLDLRARLIRDGLERAKAFSWAKCAIQTLAAYQRAAWGGSTSAGTLAGQP